MSLFTARPDRGRASASLKPSLLRQKRLWLALSCVLLPALAGCGNPAIDSLVKDLGEDSAPPGPLHRPGQPCVACHGPYYGASPRMSIAGTIFATNTLKAEDQPTPVAGAVVILTDTENKPTGPVTNCAGNFYLEYDAYQPVFPVAVEVQCPSPTDPNAPKISSLVMQGRVSREGSCNACHRGERNQGSPGWAICNALTNPGYKADPTCVGEIKPWWNPPPPAGTQ